MTVPFTLTTPLNPRFWDFPLVQGANSSIPPNQNFERLNIGNLPGYFDNQIVGWLLRFIVDHDAATNINSITDIIFNICTTDYVEGTLTGNIISGNINYHIANSLNASRLSVSKPNFDNFMRDVNRAIRAGLTELDSFSVHKELEKPIHIIKKANPRQSTYFAEIINPNIYTDNTDLLNPFEWFAFLPKNLFTNSIQKITANFENALAGIYNNHFIINIETNGLIYRSAVYGGGTQPPIGPFQKPGS